MENTNHPSNVLIFDTTLRDGEQAGHQMSPEVKLSIAHKLDELGVDIIEAGFPYSNPGDFQAVRKIAFEVRRPVICALAHAKDEIDATKNAVETAWRSVSTAAHPRIHVFIPTSDIHIERKLRMTRDQVLEKIDRYVRLAKSLCGDVEYSPEDAGRTDLVFLKKAVSVAIDSGATTINIPDTVGYQTPWTFQKIIYYLYESVPRLADVMVSVHCHNDLGLAVANTLAGIRAGARQIEGCFLGIGERAGNVALESVVMALKTREDFFKLSTNIDTKKIGPTCRFISEQIGYPIDMHAPIIGKSAFSHSSGIHRDGVNKDAQTYEIIKPETVGWIGTEMELVSQLGRSGIRKRLSEIGYDGNNLVEDVFPLFKELSSKKGVLTNEDLHMLAQECLVKQTIAREKLYDIDVEKIQYAPGVGSVHISKNGTTMHYGGIGDGPIDALFGAIRKAIIKFGENLSDLILQDYTVVKGQGGPEAIAWVVIRVRLGDKEGYGRSGHPDTVKASALAFVYAINHLLQVPTRVV